MLNYIDKLKHIVLVSFTGAVCIEHIPDIKSKIDLLSREEKNVIIDFTSIDYIETEVWNYLHKAKNQLQESNCNLVFVNMYGFVKREYDLLEYSNTISTYDSVEEGISNI